MVKGKGTQSFGKRHGRVHALCPRCGKKSYHIQGKVCSSCGFGATTKIRKSYAKDSGWNTKYNQKRGQGTGRLRHLTKVFRRARNGFKSGTPKPAVKN